MGHRPPVYFDTPPSSASLALSTLRLEVRGACCTLSCSEKGEEKGREGERRGFEPIVYRSRTRGRMFYMRTLVFPLDEVGTFRSNITDLRVHNYKLDK